MNSYFTLEQLPIILGNLLINFQLREYRDQTFWIIKFKIYIIFMYDMI